MLEKKVEQLQELEPVAAPLATTPSASFATSCLDTQDASYVRRRLRPIYSSGSLPVDAEASGVAAVASAIEPGACLDLEQIQSFARLINCEIDGLSEELKGKCSEKGNCYPGNLNLRDIAEYICLPTVVYELEYPRQERIN